MLTSKRLDLFSRLAGALIVLLLSQACVFQGPVSAVPTDTVAPGSLPATIPTDTVAPSPLPTAIPPTRPALPTSTPLPPTATAAPASVPSVPSPKLSFISMIDAQNGWGLTDQFALHTVDSGNQWLNVSPPDNPVSSTAMTGFFLDANTGWVSVPNQDFTTGILYHTTDAGRTWQSAPVPFSLGNLQFLDARNGWVLVSTGAGAGSSTVDIFNTTDGGTTWNLVHRIDPANPDAPGGLPFSGMKSGMAFLDSMHGWVGGSEPMDGYVWLFASQDGGKTWKHQDLILPVGFKNAQTLVDAPRFFNTQDGVLPVGLYSNQLARVFYSTHDGGATWTATKVAQNSGVYAIASLQDFFVWDGVTLTASHDGGQTWLKITPNINLDQTIARMDFVDVNNGWVISWDANGNSQLYKTNDGGVTWSKVGS